MTTEVKLREPIMAHGEKLFALTLRKPTGKDIAACGYPLLTDAQNPTVIRFDAPAVTKMISELAAIPTSSADMLSISDWTACAYAIASFLGDTAPTSSTATTNSAGSGATSAT